jgi:hypothetical protein
MRSSLSFLTGDNVSLGTDRIFFAKEAALELGQFVDEDDLELGNFCDDER